MLKVKSLVYPYANALFEIAKTNNQFDLWLNYLETLKNITQNQNFINLITNPKIAQKQVTSTLISFLTEPNKELHAFLSVLQENNRILLIPDIFAIFQDLVRNNENVLNVVVQSAFVMDEDDRNRIEKLLANKYSKKISMVVDIKPELIGGIKILVNDVVIDASIKGSLNKMTAKLVY